MDAGSQRADRDAAALAEILSGFEAVTVAVSGGVDSLTLAALAHRTLGARSAMVHAVSPAVPPEATRRVRALAAEAGWRLGVIDAGEFSDPDYLRNPVDRCFFCKTNLYGAIARRTRDRIVSGTNLDDLAEYRPGLDAARAHGVRHPFVEAGIAKAQVRGLARRLGLTEVAALPASPCLSSRIETAIPIEARVLRAVHRAERLLAAALPAATIRCRVRAAGIVVELDAGSLAGLGAERADALAASIARIFREGRSDPAPVSFAPYRTGSAFLREAIAQPDVVFDA